MRHRSLADPRGASRLRLLGLAVLALLAAPPAGAAEPPAPDKAFVRDYCTSCHNETDRKGRLDLAHLAFDPKDSANLAVWVKVHDRVKAGEMPPKSRPRPDAARQKAFVEGLAQSIVAAERAALAGEGRAVLRRLNRQEYENALRDLLGVPWAEIANRLPEDGEAYRFNKSGEALDMSYLQMARFMDSADYALRLAMATGLERPAKTTRKLYARDEPSLRNWWPRENGTLPDRLSFPVLDSHAQPDVRAGRAPATSPQTREREAVGKVSSIFSDAGGYSWNGWRAPVAARYKLRIAGYTIWVAGGGVARWFYEGQGAEKAPVYHTLLWHRPNLDEVYPGPAQRADRRLRLGRRPDAAGRGGRFHAQAGGARDRSLLAGERGACGPTAAGSSARASTAPTSSTSTPWRPRTAFPATPFSGSRSKARSTTTRSAGRAIGCCSTSCGWCRRRRRREAVPLEVGPAAAAGRRPRRAAEGRRRLRPRRRAQAPVRGRIRGAAAKTPSGCCDPS